VITLGIDFSVLGSSFIGRTVDLPLRAKAYEPHLKKLITGPHFGKKAAQVDSRRDTANSFGPA
jgi:hypothetical protein